MSINVLIVDSSDVVRAGLSEVLEGADCIDVVGQTGDRREAQTLTRESRPHVVMLDLGSDDSEWQEFVTTLRQDSPASRLLIFTSRDCPITVQQLLSAGADGYLVKEASGNEIVAAIKAVAAGRMIVNITELGELFSDEQTPTPIHHVDAPNKLGHNLSEREIEVLTRIARGKTNQQIATDMFLSVKTIETYRSRLAKKIGAKSRADLFEFANSAGMLA